MTTPTFETLGLAEPLLRALQAEGYTTPTPIQAQAIPLLLDNNDLLGIAQTGTGKTAAFALPLLQHLSANKRKTQPRSARALILAPTRELAIQIGDGIKAYGRHLNLRHTIILGGVKQHTQVRAMARGVDILIATPGRLLDLVNQGHVRLDQVRHLVLDEADRMLDMGFIRDVRKIVQAVPAERQTLLFSATMPREVAHLANEILQNAERIEITPKTVAVERIDQGVIFVPGRQKRALLAEMLEDPEMKRVIVFTRTKHGANRVAEQLEKQGVNADAIHGNKSQNARQKALDNFRRGRARVLVATDIAARGIDVDDVTHVINFELPNEPESYVHRIGRTARAGAAGTAISFCDGSERGYLKSIERLIKRPLDVIGTVAANDDGDDVTEDRAPRRGRPNGNRNGQKKGHRGNQGNNWSNSGDKNGAKKHGDGPRKGAKNGFKKGPKNDRGGNGSGGNGQKNNRRRRNRRPEGRKVA